MPTSLHRKSHKIKSARYANELREQRRIEKFQQLKAFTNYQQELINQQIIRTKTLEDASGFTAVESDKTAFEQLA